VVEIGLVELLLFFVAEHFLCERLNSDPASLQTSLDDRRKAACSFS
jgi:hypothetical protein